MRRLKRIGSAVFSFLSRWEQRRNDRRPAGPDTDGRVRGSTFGRIGF